MNNTISGKSATTVLCLHSSGAGGRQWRSLVTELSGRYRVLTPDLIGYGEDFYQRRTRLTIEDEVDAVMGQLADVDVPVHIVGHSYGGAVALHLAKRHPERVASLTVYEPVQLLELFEDGLDSSEAREVRQIRASMLKSMETPLGRWRAARSFVNYWSGVGAWCFLNFSQRRRVASLMPKIVAECNALLTTSASMQDVTDLNMPIRILCGARTRRTAKRVCERLADRIAGASLHVVRGVSHMAPITHAHRVNPLIAEHIDETVLRIAA